MAKGKEWGGVGWGGGGGKNFYVELIKGLWGGGGLKFGGNIPPKPGMKCSRRCARMV